MKTSELVTELRHKTPDELRDALLQYKKEQFNLRFQSASGDVQNTARIREVRRAIARVKTLLGERAREAARAAADE